MSTKAKKTRREKTVLITEAAILAALIIIMAFTPLGFLRVGALSITFTMVPVVLGSVLCGPVVGASLGGLFGILSFIQCFMGEPLGAILVSVSLFRTLIVCIVPRVIAGLVPALVFKALQKYDKKQGWSFVVAGALGSLLNTILFLGTMALMFWNISFTPQQAVSLGGADTVLKTVIMIASGLNAPVELVACTILISALGKGLSIVLKRIK